MWSGVSQANVIINLITNIIFKFSPLLEPQTAGAYKRVIMNNLSLYQNFR